MKVLIVCSGNAPNFSFEIHQAFVYDQVNAISKAYPECSFSYYFIKGKGILGYLRNLINIKKQLKNEKVDLIHAHYALSGLLANLQRSIPVVTTYHGSDINNLFSFLLSKFAVGLSYYNIFVSKKLFLKAKTKNNYSIIPCGVDLNIFKVVDKKFARFKMNLKLNSKYILFSGSFENEIKNYQLAKLAVEELKKKQVDVELIELKGYNREEVNLLINAVECVIVTSFKESGPLIVKEAMSVNKCVVSVDVGDVSEVVGETEGYYVSSYSPGEFASGISNALNFSENSGCTNGNGRIIELGLDSGTVAKEIMQVYEYVLHRKLPNTIF